MFAYAGKTDPPSSSQILSQTSAGEKVATSSIALLLFEQFLCSRRAPFHLSRPALGQRRRAQRSRLAGIRLAQPVPALPGHALTGSSTGCRHLSAAGRLIGLLAFEVAVLTEAQAIRASLLASAMASTLGCSPSLAHDDRATLIEADDVN